MTPVTRSEVYDEKDCSTRFCCLMSKRDRREMELRKLGWVFMKEEKFVTYERKKGVPTNVPNIPGMSCDVKQCIEVTYMHMATPRSNTLYDSIA
jgi:hypothetical protein